MIQRAILIAVVLTCMVFPSLGDDKKPEVVIKAKLTWAEWKSKKKAKRVDRADYITKRNAYLAKPNKDTKRAMEVARAKFQAGAINTRDYRIGLQRGKPE